MSDALRISVVTPSYNQCRYLEDCLRSVKEQSYPAAEHIVVDGGSTDCSVEMLREYSARPGWSHLRWVSERDRGQSDALNKGFRMTTGDVIGWLNSDDFYLALCFERIVKAFRQRPGTDVLYGDYFWTDGEGKPIQLRREIAFSRFVLSHTHVNYVQSSGAVFLSRRIIDDGYFLNEGYHYAMDYEFFLRLASAGYQFRRAPEVLCGFRWHEQSKTGAQANKQFEEHEKARRENLARAGRLNGLRGSRFGLTLLRYLADVRRWGEKAVRGHYFTQFQPKAISKCLSDARQAKAFEESDEY
ncbi:MAG TPA: glycosyltransferase family 2 protein [Candidatus Acidoferrum sp.]|nr:glycosyltransferase family 2 protein [Candidatus Acidoferrum sp.]